jgi:hypothetical protein
MQCKSHYIFTGTELLPQFHLHYRQSLTLESVIFARPILLYAINSHPLYVFCTSNSDLSYPADESTFQAMCGLMEQFLRIVSVFILFQMLNNTAAGIIYHSKQYYFRQRSWTPTIIKGLLSSNLSCLSASYYDKQNTSYGSVCHSYLPAVSSEKINQPGQWGD